MSAPRAATAAVASEALPWLAAPLAETLRTQRGHALLVHGPQGAGQFEFAIALARAWLCETPAETRPQGLACGHCESCHLATADQVHPDLCVLMPDALHLKLGWRQKTDEPEPIPTPAATPSPEDDQQFNESWDLDVFADRWKEGTDLSHNQDLDARRGHEKRTCGLEQGR